MSKSKAPKFRADRASELRTIERILKKLDICRNISEIGKAASFIENNNDYNRDGFWGYKIDNLIFDFKRTPRNCLPTTSKNIYIQFSLDLKGVVDNCEKIKDPFVWLKFDIVIKAIDNGQNNKDLISSFHLDRDTESDRISKEGIHPIYHFHFGGNRMDYNRYNFGQLLLLNSPRLAHYPMDLILGLDFVLANYFYIKWEKIKEDGEYNNIVRKYQEYFWKPYIHSLTNCWDFKKNEIEWAPSSKLWPEIRV